MIRKATGNIDVDHQDQSDLLMLASNEAAKSDEIQSHTEPASILQIEAADVNRDFTANSI